MVRVAILGMGFMGATHFRAYRDIPDADVVVIADRSKTRAAGDLSDVWGNIDTDQPTQLDMTGVIGSTDLDAPLHMDDVDVIDICLATPAHVEYAVKALNAGKHVICEKPMAASVAEAQPLVEAAAKARGFFMPAMCMRFWPEWAWLKHAVVEGHYGKVLSATFQRLATTPAGWFTESELSGGAAMDLHIHDTDFIHYLFGMPRAVTSQGYGDGTGCADHLVSLYHYDQVPIVAAEGGWTLAEGFEFTVRYTVNFEQVSVDFDMARSEARLKLSHRGQRETVNCGRGDGYDRELSYFVNCVKEGKPPRTVDVHQAMDSMRIVEAECHSAAQGSKRVELS